MLRSKERRSRGFSRERQSFQHRSRDTHGPRQFLAGGLAGFVFARFDLRQRGLRHAGFGGQLFLGEPEIFAPGANGRFATLDHRAHHLVGDQPGRDGGLFEPLRIGHHHKGGIPRAVMDDLNVSRCVHCVS